MQALFIGQTYIDVTFITDHMPTGDEKHVASAYAVSFGGNAVTAAFCCAKLGIVPDLIATVANDWLGRMFQDMSAKYGISIHHAKSIPRHCRSSCRKTASGRSSAAATTHIFTPSRCSISVHAVRFISTVISRTLRFTMQSCAGSPAF